MNLPTELVTLIGSSVLGGVMRLWGASLQSKHIVQTLHIQALTAKANIIPKGSRSEDYSPEQVQAIIHTINSTPRKSLSFKTPYEAFLTCSSGKQLIFSYFNNHVALQI